jgi:hypothetical protein
MPLRRGWRENAKDRFGERNELERCDENETKQAGRDRIGAIRELTSQDGVRGPETNKHKYTEREDELPGGVGGAERPRGTSNECEEQKLGDRAHLVGSACGRQIVASSHFFCYSSTTSFSSQGPAGAWVCGYPRS